MEQSPPRRIMILAGEASGDAHAAKIAVELKQRWPGVEMFGLGGPRMANAGVRLLYGLDDLAVMGFVEVIRRLSFFLRLEHQLKALLDEGEVDLLLAVDYPGLNLRVATYAAKRRVPVLYYIGPQVWAWKAGRAGRLAKVADRIAVILPFEKEIYRAHGGKCHFVGHPLLEDERVGDPDALAGQLGVDRERPVLALFPGSREQELARHTELFVGCAQRLQQRIPGVQVVVSRSPSLPESAYRHFPFPATEAGPSLRALATAALVKSGTSTLEAALANLPFAVAYVTHPLTYLLARRLVRVDHVALANLVAGRRIVPEFVQDEATTAALADAVEPLLDESSPERAEMLAGLSSIRSALGSAGAARRVVRLAEEVLAEGKG